VEGLPQAPAELAVWVRQIQPGLLARPELRVVVVRRGPLVRVLHQVHLDLLEPQARREHLALPEPQVHPGQVARLDLAVHLAAQVPTTMTMMTMTISHIAMPFAYC